MKNLTNSTNKFYLISLLATFLLFNSSASVGDVIFSDNFDATPDWQNQGSQRCNYIGWDDDVNNEADKACFNLPKNYDLMYMSDSNPANPMCQINNKGAKGSSGKGLRVYDESNGDKNSWGSDCQIAKYFPQQYEEIWVSYWIHYNPDMIWEDGTKMSKIFRIGHYNPDVVNGNAGTSTFNTNNDSAKNNGYGDTTAGLFFLDTKQVNSPELMRFQHAVRCGGTYKCGDYDEAWFHDVKGKASPSWNDTFGDDQWHHIEIRVKMNSSVGKNDGILEVYFDGVAQTKEYDIPWRMGGTKSNVTGFNMFTIAGNSNNVWAGQTNTEQWMYDVDDLQVCTTRCPNNYKALPLHPDQFKGVAKPVSN